MEEFEIIAYTKEDGKTPFAEFIKSQPAKMQAKIVRDLDLLESYGNLLEGQYTKHLDDGIFELRTKLSSDITRTLYFFYTGKRIIVTNGFVKKTQKTPQGEIDRAKRYRSDYLKREGN